MEGDKGCLYWVFALGKIKMDEWKTGRVRFLHRTVHDTCVTIMCKQFGIEVLLNQDSSH